MHKGQLDSYGPLSSVGIRLAALMLLYFSPLNGIFHSDHRDFFSIHSFLLLIHPL